MQRYVVLLSKNICICNNDYIRYRLYIHMSCNRYTYHWFLPW